MNRPVIFAGVLLFVGGLTLPPVLWWVLVGLMVVIGAICWAVTEHERAINEYAERLWLEAKVATLKTRHASLVNDFDRLLARHAEVCDEHAGCAKRPPVIRGPLAVVPPVVGEQRTAGEQS